MITVTVNGKPRELEGPLSVAALLETLDIIPAQVAVAINGEVVPRSEWPRARVSDGDAVEIVRAVGGGAPVDTKKEPLFMEALLLLLVFGAGLAAATQILVNSSLGEERGVPEALLVSVTVTYGSAVAIMLARFAVVGQLNLDTPVAALNDLLLEFAGSVRAAHLLLAVGTVVAVALFIQASLLFRRTYLVAVLVVLVVTGALVTAAGPHSGGVGIRRFGSFEEAVDAHVAATAVFGAGFLLLVAWLYRLRRAARPEFLLAVAVLGLLLGQMAVGETQYRSGLPWWLVLVHVTLATATFGTMFALAWRLGRRAGRA